MIAFSFLLLYLQPVRRSNRFPRQSNLPEIKNPLTRSSGNKKTKAEVLESRIPSQGLLKKTRLPQTN